MSSTTRGITKRPQHASWSAEQANAAFAKAKANKTAIEQIRADLGARHITFSQLVTDPPECLADKLTIDVLRWVPGIGQVRLNEFSILTLDAHVSLITPIGSLTKRDQHQINGIYRKVTTPNASRTRQPESSTTGLPMPEGDQPQREGTTDARPASSPPVHDGQTLPTPRRHRPYSTDDVNTTKPSNLAQARLELTFALEETGKALQEIERLEAVNADLLTKNAALREGQS